MAEHASHRHAALVHPPCDGAAARGHTHHGRAGHHRGCRSSACPPPHAHAWVVAAGHGVVGGSVVGGVLSAHTRRPMHVCGVEWCGGAAAVVVVLGWISPCVRVVGGARGVAALGAARRAGTLGVPQGWPPAHTPGGRAAGHGARIAATPWWWAHLPGGSVRPAYARAASVLPHHRHTRSGPVCGPCSRATSLQLRHSLAG